MLGCLRSCAGKLVLLALLAGAALAGWRWGPEAAAWVRARFGGTAPEAARRRGPELADSALARYEAFVEEPDRARLALDAAELESLLRYRLAGALPAGIQEPQVSLKGGRAVVTARVPLGYFPRVPDLDDLLAFLPDTVPLRLEASLIPLGAERLGVVVEGIEAARIPLPRRVIPGILDALGRRPDPDLPPNAFAASLPPAVRAAYIVADTLFLLRAP